MATVGTKQCPANGCNAQGSHEIYVQPMETARISLAHDPTCTYCLVWGNSELLGPRSFLSSSCSQGHFLACANASRWMCVLLPPQCCVSPSPPTHLLVFCFWFSVAFSFFYLPASPYDNKFITLLTVMFITLENSRTLLFPFDT